jgi:hypothetical protein
MSRGPLIREAALQPHAPVHPDDAPGHASCEHTTIKS